LTLLFTLLLFWHFNVSNVISCGNERENCICFGFRGLGLSFCKGVFLSFAFWKCRGIWEGKPDLSPHFTHSPAWTEGERTEKNKAIRKSTIEFVVRPSIHLRCGVFYLSIEPWAFALLVLTLNWNHFWCETCLCVSMFASFRV